VVESSSKPRATEQTAVVRFTARVNDAGAAERLAAEAWDAGSSGIEERQAAEGVELLIYAPSAAAERVRSAVVAAGEAFAVTALEGVPQSDWSESWKRGLRAIEISPRLRVRPSCVAAGETPGQVELVIDPGQAFGTGGHESTRLALEWIDALASDLPRHSRVLDVGTGTGVLALAAIRLAGARALGFDLDPLAAQAATGNAAANGIHAGLDLFTGPLAALGDVTFDLVVANLLRSELLPLIDGIAACTAPGGFAVFSGLLSSECDRVVEALRAAGFTPAGAREAHDANDEGWTALLMKR
jgi:ribosomal protein L11 methyltransferase